jgi:LysR family hydrogen peroxide-inducible transcriptional activator
LQYLLALHEYQHFGRAAAAAFVTQSTLSAGIADLERLLGTVLVERTKRAFRFTSIGEEVVERARALIRGAEDICETARASRQPLSGPIRLAAIPTVAPFLLPLILPAIGKAWPDSQLFIREMLTTSACEALHRGTIDCVLLALPTDCGDTESFEITVDRLMLVTSDANHAVNIAIHPEAIDITRLLLLEDGHCLKDHVLAVCDRTTAGSEAMLVASTLHTLVQLVDAGLGITLLPEMAIKAGILSGTGVRSQALLGESAQRRIALVWRKGSARGPDYQLLGDTIRKAVFRRASDDFVMAPKQKWRKSWSG